MFCCSWICISDRVFTDDDVESRKMCILPVLLTSPGNYSVLDVSAQLLKQLIGFQINRHINWVSKINRLIKKNGSSAVPQGRRFPAVPKKTKKSDPGNGDLDRDRSLHFRFQDGGQMIPDEIGQGWVRRLHDMLLCLSILPCTADGFPVHAGRVRGSNWNPCQCRSLEMPPANGAVLPAWWLC